MSSDQVCVLGLGYIGLPTASMLATHGMQVLGVDNNPDVVATLNAGGLHVHEPGLAALVRSAVDSGNLRIGASPEACAAFLIAVPTPFREGTHAKIGDREYKLADLDAVCSAAESIVPHLRKGSLVIIESTCPVGTTAGVVAPILERSGLKAGIDFHLCYSPERVLPGRILTELIENARIMGGLTPACASAGAALYRRFVSGTILETNAPTAEMVKLMENTYRDVNIAIANEFSRLADRNHVDVWEAIRLANLHPRVRILNPGPGVGGHCISVDPWFLVESAPELTPLIFQARQVNDSQPEFVIARLKSMVGTLQKRTIAVLGLAYKADVDDVRESPAVRIAHLLEAEGARLSIWEPFRASGSVNGLELAPSLSAAMSSADVVLLLVAHTAFRQLTPAAVAPMTSARLVLDTVNAWNGPEWSAAGFTVHRLGDGRVPIPSK